MPLTAHQYNSLWKERIAKEEAAAAEAEAAQAEIGRPRRANGDDSKSHMSTSSKVSSISRGSYVSAYTEVSSAVSSSSATARKIEMLQRQLKEETEKRQQVESKLIDTCNRARGKNYK
eukprot:6188664-Pleurochrysis_carterae.AAC.2